MNFKNISVKNEDISHVCTDFTKPFHFTYQSSTYSYEPVSAIKCKLSLPDGSFVDGGEYVSRVRDMVSRGIWKPIECLQAVHAKFIEDSKVV